MLTSVLTGYLGALVAPWLQRAAPRAAAALCAGLPMALFVYFARRIGPAGSHGMAVSQPWVPSLGVDLSFTLDGLSLLFALVITGMGSLVILYASDYLEGHRHLGMLYAFLLGFMASMLGLVLAGNLVVLYVFWELTSIASYLLIGFDHRQEKARNAALQALLVTGAGGLALLAGFLLLGHIGGTLEIARLMPMGEAVRTHPLYLPALLLILAGAFTKSAQFPFHFWLPSAMVAPTPVSAYLHSAAMVNAGLYLLARLAPVLSGSSVWHCTIAGVGAITMLVGAIMAFPQEDLKLVLAYSTVGALGMLMLLLGLGTTAAITAFVVYLLVHVLYKGALFLVAGAVDHAAGTRQLNKLGGLWSKMPIVAMAAVLAASSMAGIPPLIGFIGKELVYEAKLLAPQGAWIITAAGVAANVVMVALAGMVGFAPFFPGRTGLALHPHPVTWQLWAGPFVLALLGALMGLFPAPVGRMLFGPAIGAIRSQPVAVHLVLWHGINTVLLLGASTVVLGVLLYAGRQRLLQALTRGGRFQVPGPERGYQLLLEGVLRLARVQTGLLQSGYLRVYLKVVLGFVVALFALALWRRGQLPAPGAMTDAYLHEWFTAGVIIAGAVTVAATRSRLAAVAALGAVGYGTSLIYLLFGAPDLAMTQFCIETLTVILFVLVLYRLPQFSILSGGGARLRDLLVALSGGAMMTLLTLLSLSQPLHAPVSRYFAQGSKPLAHGRNVVNVILVDFRGLDTLGEITVLSAAAIGVYGLLKFGIGERK